MILLLFMNVYDVLWLYSNYLCIVCKTPQNRSMFNLRLGNKKRVWSNLEKNIKVNKQHISSKDSKVMFNAVLGQDSKVIDLPNTLRVGEFLALGILSLCPGGTAAWNVRLRFGNDLLAHRCKGNGKQTKQNTAAWLLSLMIFYMITIIMRMSLFIPVLYSRTKWYH